MGWGWPEVHACEYVINSSGYEFINEILLIVVIGSNEIIITCDSNCDFCITLLNYNALKILFVFRPIF